MSVHPAFNPREYVGATTVTALAAGFGAVLTAATAALTSAMGLSGADQLRSVQLALGTVSWLFLGIALFVGAIVTVNTFGTIIAGRQKTLALLRLLGASARSLRRTSALEGLSVGILGALAGTLLGSAATQLLLLLGRRAGRLQAEVTAPWFSLAGLWPALAAVAVTTLSAWLGSRRITGIAPVTAFSGSTAAGELDAGRPHLRRRSALLAGVLGLGLMGVGMAAGMMSPSGVLIALPGGILSFTAFMLVAEDVLPRLLRLGEGLGAGAAARLAARNTARNPRRSCRATVGIVIGVGMISMFAVAGSTYRDLLVDQLARQDSASPEEIAALREIFSIPITIAMVLVGCSALIAAVGLVNSLTLSTIQREQELGLLRALGLTRGQVRGMQTLEAARMALIAALLGVLIGTGYAWVGSVAMLGSQLDAVGRWWPTVPWQLLAAVLAGAVTVTILAALSTSRRALTVAPVRALSVV